METRSAAAMTKCARSSSGSQSFMSGGSRNAWLRSQWTKVAMPNSSQRTVKLVLQSDSLLDNLV